MIKNLLLKGDQRHASRNASALCFAIPRSLAELSLQLHVPSYSDKCFGLRAVPLRMMREQWVVYFERPFLYNDPPAMLLLIGVATDIYFCLLSQEAQFILSLKCEEGTSKKNA